MEQSFKTIAKDPVAIASGVDSSASSVLQWLSRMEQEWLLVFDNADGDSNIVGQYLPTGARGNILFTSRNPTMGDHVSSPKARVEVDAMDEADAISLLLKSAMLDESSSELAQPARVIVKILNCLPLAIDQAGTAIAGNICTIHDYPALHAIPSLPPAPISPPPSPSPMDRKSSLEDRKSPLENKKPPSVDSRSPLEDRKPPPMVSKLPYSEDSKPAPFYGEKWVHIRHHYTY